MVSITGTPVVAYIQPVLTGYIFGYLQNTIIHLEYVPHLHWIRQKIPLDKHAKLCATLFSMRSHRKYQIPTHQSLQNTHKFTRPLRDTPCCSKKPIHTWLKIVTKQPRFCLPGLELVFNSHKRLCTCPIGVTLSNGDIYHFDLQQHIVCPILELPPVPFLLWIGTPYWQDNQNWSKTPPCRCYLWSFGQRNWPHP